METTKTGSAKRSASLSDIRKFLESKKIAIAGASRNPRKFGGTVLSELKKKEFEVYPVNPNTDEIYGIKCYRTIADLPEDVKNLLILTPKTETSNIADEAIRKGMEMVWIQQMSDTPEAVNAINKAGIQLIYKKCILMFADPVKGPHQFHRFLVKLFGKYPKSVKVDETNQ
jgi:uncharacterized protein